MNSSTSVGCRFRLLVGCQVAIVVVLMVLADWTISRASADYRHMYEFQFKPVVAIGEAINEASVLRNGSQSTLLEAFYRRYRNEWQTASGVSADAIQFRKDLLQAGASDLLSLERAIIEDLGKCLQEKDADGIRAELADLYELNVTYARLENEYVTTRARNGRIWLIVIGCVGVAANLFFGWYFWRAIAPRIQRLVSNVRHFQKFGWTNRIGDTGHDDIALLANALDVGFSAIASRERDRERFLAIVAHELKTPVTSIYGYASLLVRHPLPMNEMQDALNVINRQSWRLNRLIDALFLTGQARAGQLRFEPKPINMSEIVLRVLHEIGARVSKRLFIPEIERDVSILGDEALIEHALWALFASASAFSGQDVSIRVSFRAVRNRARLTIDISGKGASLAEIEELFTPFQFVEYETGAGLRSAIGLYLCREIVRLHNGFVRVEQTPEGIPEFVMELPI